MEISIQDAPHQSMFSDIKEKKKNNCDKTPIPANSPLFTQVLDDYIPTLSSFTFFLFPQPAVNESIKQLKNFNRSLKKAQSFRAAREKIDKVI